MPTLTQEEFDLLCDFAARGIDDALEWAKYVDRHDTAEDVDTDRLRARAAQCAVTMRIVEEREGDGATEEPDPDPADPT